MCWTKDRSLAHHGISWSNFRLLLKLSSGELQEGLQKCKNLLLSKFLFRLERRWNCQGKGELVAVKWTERSDRNGFKIVLLSFLIPSWSLVFRCKTVRKWKMMLLIKASSYKPICEWRIDLKRCKMIQLCFRLHSWSSVPWWKRIWK